jgi:hypothetical protein
VNAIGHAGVKDGRVVTLHGTIQDITSSVQAESQVKQEVEPTAPSADPCPVEQEEHSFAVSSAYVPARHEEAWQV